MDENNKQENKVANFLTKETKVEKYLFPLLGLVAIVFAILIKIGKIEVKQNGEIATPAQKTSMIIVLLILGFFALISGIIKLIKEQKYKKTVYHDILNDYHNHFIKKNLVDEDLDLQAFDVELENNSISLLYKVHNGNFCCFINKTDIVYSFDYSDEFVDNMTDEEIENLPLYEIGGFNSILDYDKEKVYKEFIKLIKDNINNI